MKSKKLCLPAVILTAALGADALGAQTAPQMTRDQVFRAVAEKVVAQSESPVTNVMSAVDEVIEVGEISAPDANGKVTVKVRERAAAGGATLNREIKLVFAPAGEKRWNWESFENDRRMYPVERLFPYVKNELAARQKATRDAWTRILDAMTKQADAAAKLLDTAKAVIKQDPAPLAPLTQARAALAKARESGEVDAIKAAHKEVVQAVEPIAALPDSHPDLKANDAYLRLADELSKTKENIAKAREEYLNAVRAYNDALQRNPYSLAAYGLGFQKMEPLIEAE
jgi:LemA protein